ncbi:type III effector protein (plasmid) [Ralstonia solanacearum Po82]|uniref:Type III effector protein n=2 Tax=Ralstonia solanacearum TaxID=305 RepID=F6GBB5_RALS8|nr:type III effector protein [Ralstonia solanacearum Po82]
MARYAAGNMPLPPPTQWPVSMSPSVPLSADALIDRIRIDIRRTGDAPDLAARHERFYLVMQALRSEILALSAREPDDASVVRCIRVFHEEIAVFKQAHAIARLPYSPDVDRRYPFRDAAGNPVYVDTLEPTGRPALGPRSYSADPVRPYLEADATPEVRGAHYHGRLHCRTMTPADLRDPREGALVGERGVFAARRIEAGECLGVYGGRLMTPATHYTCLDDAYVLSTSADGIESSVDGENILAMANTVFAYEGEHAVSQADDGYTMEAAVFQATTRCGRRLAIRAFFAIETVQAGDELRWNYRYAPALIQQRFGGLPAGALTAESASAA